MKLIKLTGNVEPYWINPDKIFSMERAIDGKYTFIYCSEGEYPYFYAKETPEQIIAMLEEKKCGECRYGLG